MSEFVSLFRATEEEQRQAIGTPEWAQQSMQAMLAGFVRPAARWVYRRIAERRHCLVPGLPARGPGA
jgi:hypothetical protein